MKIKNRLTKLLVGMLLVSGISMLPQVPAEICYGAEVTAVTELRSTSPSDSTGFVVLADVVPDIVQEIRYYSTYNFVGDRIDGYTQPVALMTREAALALKEV